MSASPRIFANTVASILPGAVALTVSVTFPVLISCLRWRAEMPLTVNVGCETFGAISVALPGIGKNSVGATPVRQVSAITA